MPAPTYALPGNVDVPGAVAGVRPARGLPAVDGRVVEIGGLRFGFVGGVPLPPGRRAPAAGRGSPTCAPHEEFAAAVRALGRPSTCCAATPRPRCPSSPTTWCRGGRRPAAPALLEVVRRDRPRAALFGHVHQPLAPRVRVGRTECVNVGHFRRTGRPVRAALVSVACAGGNLPAMADATTSSITIAAPPERVMAVIADFAAYPQWADQVKTSRSWTTGDAGPRRARAVHDGRRPDQGLLHAGLHLGARRAVGELDLVKGQIQKAQHGSYALAGDRRRDDGHLHARRRPQHPDDRHAPAQGREGDHRHGAEGPEAPRGEHC